MDGILAFLGRDNRGGAAGAVILITTIVTSSVASDIQSLWTYFTNWSLLIQLAAYISFIRRPEKHVWLQDLATVLVWTVALSFTVVTAASSGMRDDFYQLYGPVGFWVGNVVGAGSFVCFSPRDCNAHPGFCFRLSTTFRFCSIMRHFITSSRQTAKTAPSKENRRASATPFLSPPLRRACWWCIPSRTPRKGFITTIWTNSTVLSGWDSLSSASSLSSFSSELPSRKKSKRSSRVPRKTLGCQV